MAAAPLPDQPNINCNSCKEALVKFRCKTCSAQFCERCTQVHKTESHEIESLTSNCEDMLDNLFCLDHTKKKLECYCKVCERPVCTDCIVASHNGHGHTLEKLSTVYEKIANYFRRQQHQIKNDLLPKYRDLSASEDAKIIELKNRTDEIERKIDVHIMNVISMVKNIGTQTSGDLRMAEREDLQKCNDFKNKVDDIISELKKQLDSMSAKIKAKPTISFFEATKGIDFEEFQKLPTRPHYSIHEFHAGKIIELIKKELSDIKTIENGNELYKQTKQEVFHF